MTAIASEAVVRKLEVFHRRLGVPALGAAVFTTDTEPVVEVVGQRIRSGQDAVLREDLWHIGSCAKSFTAALVGRLVEDGATHWDAPLNELFDDLELDPAWSRVTLSQLLTHRAGVPANLSPPKMKAALVDDRPLTEQRAEAASQTLSMPPEQIGSFLYSNLGYILVGAALERLTSVPFEQLLAAKLLIPLGIAHFGYGAPVGDQPWGHRPRLGGLGRGPAVDPTVTGSIQPADNPPIMSPAGRVHLSLDDWSRFVRMFLIDGTHLLSQATIDRLITPADGPGATQGMGWASASSSKVAFGQQGSNRRWVATALVSADRRAAAMVVCNDGRTRVLIRTPALAADLLG